MKSKLKNKDLKKHPLLYGGIYGTLIALDIAASYFIFRKEINKLKEEIEAELEEELEDELEDTE